VLVCSFCHVSLEVLSARSALAIIAEHSFLLRDHTPLQECFSAAVEQYRKSSNSSAVKHSVKQIFVESHLANENSQKALGQQLVKLALHYRLYVHQFKRCDNMAQTDCNSPTIEIHQSDGNKDCICDQSGWLEMVEIAMCMVSWFGLYVCYWYQRSCQA